jgi:NNP family nitrate/nitrite transporter-like MFS transporter
MGATMRIPASFYIRLAGGRNTIFLTTCLLMIPAVWTGFALQDKNTPLWVFQACAFLSGLGGGNFACSMSNISGFFPRKAGHRLGLNAGLGQFWCDHHADFDSAGDDGGLVWRLRSGWLDGASQGQRLDFGQDRGGYPHLHTKRGFIWAAILVPLVSRLVWHEQPAAAVAQLPGAHWRPSARFFTCGC